MAKAKRVRSEGQSKALTKKQIARSKKVKRQQQRIWLGVAAVVLFMFAILVIGIVQEYVVSPRQPVATVNGEEISRADYQKRVRYDQWELLLTEQRLISQQSQYDPNDETLKFFYDYIGGQVEQVRQLRQGVPQQALEDLINEALVRQEATRRGLTVSEDEVDQAIERWFGYDRNPPQPTPTPITMTTVLTPTTPITPMTREEFEESFGQYLEAMRSAAKGFTQEDYRNFVIQALLLQKLRESVGAQVPTTDEHVHAYHILVEDEETATEVLDRLNNGEDFADLVAQYSTDEDSKEKGGELGWLAEDQMDAASAVVDAAFALQPGEFSEAVESYKGYHIITIDERRADYPLDETTLSSRQSQAFTDWLDQARETATIERTWTLEDVPTD